MHNEFPFRSLSLTRMYSSEQVIHHFDLNKYVKSQQKYAITVLLGTLTVAKFDGI